MSDCSANAWRRPEPACRIEIEFQGGHEPWVYPLALNGRSIAKVRIGGVEYAPRKRHEEDLGWLSE